MNRADTSVAARGRTGQPDQDIVGEQSRMLFDLLEFLLGAVLYMLGALYVLKLWRRWIPVLARRRKLPRVAYRAALDAGRHTVDPVLTNFKSKYAVDWMPFFNAWEFHGTYPAVLQDSKVGEAARSLFADAQAMMDKVVSENWLQPRGVLGLFHANTIDHDSSIVSKNRADSNDGAHARCEIAGQTWQQQREVQ